MEKSRTAYHFVSLRDILLLAVFAYATNLNRRLKNLIYGRVINVAIMAWLGEKEEGGWFWPNWAGPVSWYQQFWLVHKLDIFNLLFLNTRNVFGTFEQFWEIFTNFWYILKFYWVFTQISKNHKISKQFWDLKFYSYLAYFGADSSCKTSVLLVPVVANICYVFLLQLLS